MTGSAFVNGATHGENDLLELTPFLSVEVDRCLFADRLQRLVNTGPLVRERRHGWPGRKKNAQCVHVPGAAPVVDQAVDSLYQVRLGHADDDTSLGQASARVETPVVGRLTPRSISNPR
jgi:hypothetical protein